MDDPAGPEEKIIGEVKPVSELVRDTLTKQPENTRAAIIRNTVLRHKIMSGCGYELARDGLLHTLNYQQITDLLRKFGISDKTGDLANFPTPGNAIKRDVNIWDVSKDSPEYKFLCDLLDFLSSKSEQLDKDRKVLEQNSSEILKVVNRNRLIQLVCEDLIKRMGVELDSDLIAEFIAGIKFNPGYPKPSYKPFGTQTVTVALATPEDLSPDCLLNEDFIDDDISFIWHEFMHHLRKTGAIKFDIAVPTASAIGQLYILRGRASKTGWNVAQSKIEAVERILSDSNLDNAYCQIVLNEKGSAKPADVIRKAQEFDQTHEPDISYLQGSILGVTAFLIEGIAKDKGIDITAENFLYQLSQGKLPSEILSLKKEEQ